MLDQVDVRRLCELRPHRQPQLPGPAPVGALLRGKLVTMEFGPTCAAR